MTLAKSIAPPEDLAVRVGLALIYSSGEDLTAVVAMFPDSDGESRRYDVLATFFLPEAGLARKAETDRADYLRWRDAGVLRVTDGKRGGSPMRSSSTSPSWARTL